MNKISKKDIEYIASLARINLTESNKQKYQQEIAAILDFVSQLRKVDTENIEATSSVFNLCNITRQDEITNKPAVEELLKNAPDKKGTSIRTKKVL